MEAVIDLCGDDDTDDHAPGCRKRQRAEPLEVIELSDGEDDELVARRIAEAEFRQAEAEDEALALEMLAESDEALARQLQQREEERRLPMFGSPPELGGGLPARPGLGDRGGNMPPLPQRALLSLLDSGFPLQHPRGHPRAQLPAFLQQNGPVFQVPAPFMRCRAGASSARVVASAGLGGMRGGEGEGGKWRQGFKTLGGA